METPVRPGDVLLGKYRVERVLGRGGMGIVVAARHLDLEETFAIKFLLPQALSIPQAVERFLREARASARLKGEHVAKVHDVGRLESGAPYMVMEHLDGSDLKTLLRNRGPLPVDEAVALMLQACDALEEAHSLGIVHRDLKPANLFLIRRPNGTPCLKVLDFGISKQLAQDTENLTASGEVLGTPSYMPPEQMLRLKDADPRSDLWAIGVILYELVTGTRPFHAESMTEIVARVLQEEPAPPSGLRSGLPAWLDAVVGRCLQKRPEHRFQSVGELALALRSQGREHGADAETVPVPSRTSAPSVRSAVPSMPPVSTPPSVPPVSTPSVPSSTWGSPLHGSQPPLIGEGMPAGAHAAVQSSPSLITASAWGTTGAGVKPARSAGKVTAIIAAGLGFTVSLIVVAWVFVGRGPTQGASEPDRMAASPAAEARPPESPPILVAPTSAGAPDKPLAGEPDAKTSIEGAAPAPTEAPIKAASSANTEAPRAPATSPKTSPKAATKPTAKPTSTYDGLY